MSPSSISTSNRQILGKACLKVGVFLAPILLFGIFCELIFWRSRDCWPRKWVIEAFAKDPRTLYGPRYFAPDTYDIKLDILRKGKAEIVALGSSRVTQFRSEMFEPLGGEFFNAGLMARSTSEVCFLTSQFATGKLPTPKVMIIGIDLWWLKQKQGKSGSADSTPRAEHRDNNLAAAAHIEAMRRLCTNFRVPLSILDPRARIEDPYYHYNAIGLGALSGNSFRADGSVLHAEYVIQYMKAGHYVDRETPPVIQQIRRHAEPWGPTTGLDITKAQRIVQALADLKAAGVEVFAFLPPLSTEADEALATMPETAAWYEQFNSDFVSMLGAADISVVHVRSPATYALPDDYMLDGFHPSDVLMARVVDDIVSHAPPQSYLKSVDLGRLQRLRENPKVIPLSLDPPPLPKAAPPQGR